MSDLIDRNMAITHVNAVLFPKINTAKEAEKALRELPTAGKRGKWTEKHHAYSDEESVIEEWQSCRCSECGRYDTRPYLYYFSEPNYCSYCGADMRGDTDA